MAKKNCSKIGGQAVLEGVMMRGKSVIATAVRDADGNIQVESARFTPFSERSLVYRVPILRGIVSFVSSMVMGTKTLMRASEVYGDLASEQPSKFEKWMAKKFKLNIMDVVAMVGIILGLALSIFLFVFIPNILTDGFYKLVNVGGLSNTAQNIIKNLTSGVIRLTIFVAYIMVTTAIKDIKRLYRYHGAEHKTISCYENGHELTVENVQKMSTVHDRCGTTFMFIIMFISIIFFSFFSWNVLRIRLLIRIIGIPIVAGISYEIIMLLSNYDNKLVRIFKYPGLLLQKLTTKEPDDGMVEVAITAFNTVLEMENDKTITASKFVTAITLEKAKEKLLSRYTDIDSDTAKSEIDLILMAVTRTKTKSELSSVRIMSTHIDDSMQIIDKRLTGMPLQYAIGHTCFYGYDIKVDERVLIPRFDTELLAEQAINHAKAYQNPKILDLCTGSGALAIAIKLNTDSTVVASDISAPALTLASQNAIDNNADIMFIESDLFDNIAGQFDIIVANPPYIPTADIGTLQKEVGEYEPKLALDGGIDGLDYYKKIAKEYDNYLSDNGRLIIELGIEQWQAVSNLFGGGQIIKDYNTPPIERILIVKKQKSDNKKMREGEYLV